MTVFPGGHSQCAPDRSRENCQPAAAASRPGATSSPSTACTFRLEPGEAIYVPVMAPHQVRNGPEPSISLSITWRSEWSHAEADARAFNEVCALGLRSAAARAVAGSQQGQVNRVARAAASARD
jgi:hypothetical protein